MRKENSSVEIGKCSIVYLTFVQVTDSIDRSCWQDFRREGKQKASLKVKAAADKKRYEEDELCTEMGLPILL